jgi:DNA-binding NarL/FixJ family response regulator
MTTPIRIILADDHSLVRTTLATWLNALPDIRVVATVESADAALSAALNLRPDVVLLDIAMPGQDSFDAARAIQTQVPQARIIFLSAFFNDRYIEQALAMRAAGYLTKVEDPETVARAIREVRAGGVCFSPEVRARFVIGETGVRLAASSNTRTASLTPRELELVRYLGRAMSRRQVAQIMHLSVHTVDRHTTSAMQKLGIHNRAELCRYAIREGLAEA